MGCGKSKSKQDVATGNTVVRKNSTSESPRKISTAAATEETTVQNENQQLNDKDDDSKTGNAHVAESPQPNQVESTVEIAPKDGGVAVEEEGTAEIGSAVSEISSEYASPLPHGIVVNDEPNSVLETTEDVVVVDESQSTQIINETPDIIKEPEAEAETIAPAAESTTSDIVAESSTSDIVVEKKDEKVSAEE